MVSKCVLCLGASGLLLESGFKVFAVWLLRDFGAQWFQSFGCLVALGFFVASSFRMSCVWLFREFWLQVVSDFTVAGCFGTFGCNLL